MFEATMFLCVKGTLFMMETSFCMARCASIFLQLKAFIKLLLSD